MTAEQRTDFSSFLQCITLEQAHQQLPKNLNVFGTPMVKAGDASGIRSGSVHTRVSHISFGSFCKAFLNLAELLHVIKPVVLPPWTGDRSMCLHCHVKDRRSLSNPPGRCFSHSHSTRSTSMALDRLGRSSHDKNNLAKFHDFRNGIAC